MSLAPRQSESPACFPSGFIFDRTVSDSEQMKELAAFWKIEQVQLEPGAYAGRVRAAHTAGIQVALATRSRSTQIDGFAPPGSVVLAAPLGSTQRIYFRKGGLKHDEFAVIRPGEEIAAKVIGASRILSIALAASLLDELAGAHGCGSFSMLCPGDRLKVDTANGATPIRARVTALLDEEVGANRPFDMAAAERFQLEVLAALFPHVRAPHAELPAPERRQLARRAEIFLRGHARGPLSLFTVCRALGAAPRTLELGFHETFGISPKAFVQALRFNGAHRELLAADPAATSVKAIALDWGFNHLGRFATEYRRWFGESPSATIGRAGRSGFAAYEFLGLPGRRGSRRSPRSLRAV